MVTEVQVHSVGIGRLFVVMQLKVALLVYIKV